MFDMRRAPQGRPVGRQWVLGSERADGQRTMQGISWGVRPRKREVIWRPLALLHPWQSDPPLPNHVTVDLSNHYPMKLPGPVGWEVWQRNARVFISSHHC